MEKKVFRQRRQGYCNVLLIVCGGKQNVAIALGYKDRSVDFALGGMLAVEKGSSSLYSFCNTRGDFNTLDNPFHYTSDPTGDHYRSQPAAGMHFLIFQPTIGN